MKEKNCIRKKASALAFSLVMVIAIFASVPSAMAASAKTYTLDADFDEGILANLEHDTVADQLQLSKNLVSLPFIWVPNSDEGTVSKVDTETGNELGRYRTGPNQLGSPSRTTVDLKGNVWFGNRNTGTVVKIGLNENGQCKDKNGNGTIETSQDLDNNGNVTGAEILPWGTDECVLQEILLGNSGSGPRGIAIDSNNNLWAGTNGFPYKYYYIDGETGGILRVVDVSTANNGGPHTAYGAVIDPDGNIWSSSLNSHLLKIDPSTDPATITRIGLTRTTYGMGIDDDGHIFNSGWGVSSLARIVQATNAVDWYKPQGDAFSRGVAVTSDKNIWIANSNTGTVTRLTHDGVLVATIPVGNMPTGVAVDKNGKVWVVNYNDGYIKRIDPATNTIDLSKLILGNDGIGISHHYGYSDMTGFISRTITTQTGTWNVDFDSGTAGTPWGTVSWNSNEPAGTTVSVRVRSSDDKATWSVWEDASNGVKLTSTSNGRYLQVETTLQITSGDVSPILYDLSVKVDNQPPTAEAGGPYTVDEGSPVTLDGSVSTDPDGDVLTYAWDLDNDGIYETPGVTATLTPTDGPATLTVGLQVSDESGVTSTDTATVTVNNVAPTAKIDLSYFVDVPMELIIAGQGKIGNSVELQIIQNGAVVASKKITRTTNCIIKSKDDKTKKSGSKEDDSKDNENQCIESGSLVATIDLSKPYNGKLIFDTTEAISGGTPVWIKADGEKEKITTFNTQKGKPSSYHQEYNFELDDLFTLKNKEITFSGKATDPGTDDLTFNWNFGDGGLSSKFYAWSGSHEVTDTVKHAYTSGSGPKTITLNVTDDDGGIGLDTITINLNSGDGDESDDDQDESDDEHDESDDEHGGSDDDHDEDDK
jgi:streptogramin lyase